MPENTVKIGRPPLPDSERLKNTVLVRFTDAEYLEIEAMAVRLSTPKAVIVRRCAMDGVGKLKSTGGAR